MNFHYSAFDASPDELAEMRNETDVVRSASGGFWKRNSYFVVGALCFLLAVIGLISLVRWLAGVAGGFMGGASTKKDIEQALYPVAVVDMGAFDSPDSLNAEQMFPVAIMDIIMHDDLSNYEVNFEIVSISGDIVAERANQLFGVMSNDRPNVKAGDESFYYDAVTGCYNVPEKPFIFSYFPEIEDIQRNDNTYTCTVLYKGDTAGWQERSDNYVSENEKKMLITVTKMEDYFRIDKIQNIS
ncbi:MAG TPA: hypothetical protein DCO72_10185 [Ruminococcus sp.]|nr:hypothetical protein [Ruminococcus sp.]